MYDLKEHLIDLANRAGSNSAMVQSINELFEHNPKLQYIRVKPFASEHEQDMLLKRIVGRHGPRVTRREMAQRLSGYAAFRNDPDGDRYQAIYFAIDRAVSAGFLTPEGDDGKAFTLSSPNARPATLPANGNE